MLDASFPVLLTTKSVIVTFLITWAAAHLLFVRVLKIGKIGWKRTDYAWLLLAVFGLIGTAGQARRVAAVTTLREMEWRQGGSFEALRNVLDSYSRPEMACRTFGRGGLLSEAELATLQREFDIACAWFQDLAARIPRTPPDKPLEESLKRPADGPPDLNWMFEAVERSVADFNEVMRRKAEAEESREMGNLELLLLFLSPFMVAVAVGIRVAKVGGEIRLDRLAAATPASQCPAPDAEPKEKPPVGG